MADNQSEIIISRDGLPMTKSPAAWDRLPDSEKAALLSQWTKTWSGGGSGASVTSARTTSMPAPPKIFDDQDRTITAGEWQPSTEQLAGTKGNEWK